MWQQLGVAVSAFNFTSLELVDLCESKISLVYKVRSRLVNSETFPQQQKLIYKRTGFVMIPFSFLFNRDSFIL